MAQFLTINIIGPWLLFLFVINWVIIYSVRKDLYEERSMGCCGDVIISITIVFIASTIALFPISLVSLGWLSSIYFWLCMFAMDAFLVMLWVLWKLGYLSGQRRIRRV